MTEREKETLFSLSLSFSRDRAAKEFFTGERKDFFSLLNMWERARAVWFKKRSSKKDREGEKEKGEKGNLLFRPDCRISSLASKGERETMQGDGNSNSKYPFMFSGSGTTNSHVRTYISHNLSSNEY